MAMSTQPPLLWDPAESSSRVMSTDTAPVANLGQDELLSCFLTSSTSAALTQVSVTWERKDLNALVYGFDNGAPDLGKQDPQYKDRTQLFTSLLVSGNASLLLRNVRSSDGGVYTCTIGSSGGGGTVNINLRTAGTMSLSSSRVCFTNAVPQPFLLNITHCSQRGLEKSTFTHLPAFQPSQLQRSTSPTNPCKLLQVGGSPNRT